jgi:hypothetical protein
MAQPELKAFDPDAVSAALLSIAGAQGVSCGGSIDDPLAAILAGARRFAQQTAAITRDDGHVLSASALGKIELAAANAINGYLTVAIALTSVGSEACRVSVAKLLREIELQIESAYGGL